MAALDFLSAWSKHLAWKMKLKSFLDGSGEWALTEAQVTSHRDCELGKWLYSRGLEKYGGLPAMKELERTHKQFHSAVRRVVAMKNAGDRTGAEREFSTMEPLSNKIIALLEQMDKQVVSAE